MPNTSFNLVIFLFQFKKRHPFRNILFVKCETEVKYKFLKNLGCYTCIVILKGHIIKQSLLKHVKKRTHKPDR